MRTKITHKRVVIKARYLGDAKAIFQAAINPNELSDAMRGFARYVACQVTPLLKAGPTRLMYHMESHQDQRLSNLHCPIRHRCLRHGKPRKRRRHPPMASLALSRAKWRGSRLD